MTDEEFIIKAQEILGRNGIYTELCTNSRALVAITSTYFERENLKNIALEILEAERQIVKVLL